MTDSATPKPLDPSSADDLAEFDLDAWIDDAKPPQRSMTVYRRADLYSRVDELEREIRLADGSEGSSADAGVKGLKAELDKVARQIYDSAVTITVRAVTDDAAKQARADAKAEGIKARAAQEWDDEGYVDEASEQAEDEAQIEGLDGEDREALIRRRVVEARRAYINNRWIEAVGEHLLVRLLVSPKMTIEQVRSLSEQIGSAQRDKLMKLPGQAAGDQRPVGANFSQPASRRPTGDTSSKQSARRTRGGSHR